MIRVGQQIVAETEFIKDGVHVVTGSASTQWWRWNGATREYLQSDGSTFSASAHSFAATLDAATESWVHKLTAPASAADYELVWEMAHSDPDLIPTTDGFYVSTNDLDSMNSNILTRLGTPAGASVSDDIAANLSAIQNIQNNTFIGTNIPAVLELPDSGSEAVSVTVIFNNETGSPTDIDAAANPSVILVNNAGTDLSGRLGSWSHPATGKYTNTYTNSSAHALESIHWEITGTVNTKLRRHVLTTQLVDTTAVDFTAADRTKLNTIFVNADTTISSRESESSAASRAAADIAEHDATQAAIAALQTHGDIAWITATGFATPANVSASTAAILLVGGDGPWGGGGDCPTVEEIHAYLVLHQGSGQWDAVSIGSSVLVSMDTVIIDQSPTEVIESVGTDVIVIDGGGGDTIISDQQTTEVIESDSDETTVIED